MHIKFIFIFLLYLLCKSFYAQSVNIDDYPTIITDESGNKYVIMTIEQARIIDNKLDYIDILEKYNFNCDSFYYYSNEIIYNLNNQIDLLNEKILYLNNNIKLYEEKSMILNKQIDNEKQKYELLKMQNDININEMKYLRAEIRKQKILKIVSYIASGVLIISVIFLSLSSK